MKNYIRLLTGRINYFPLGLMFFGFFNFFHCQEIRVEKSPYEVFSKKVRIKRLTDTILVMNKTKIFGCGTAAKAYGDSIIKSGKADVYMKYGSILNSTNRKFLSEFEKNNQVKIIWINVGNEGELFEFEDSELQNNRKLLQKLIKEKSFVTFDYMAGSTTELTIVVTAYNPVKRTSRMISFSLNKNQKDWELLKAEGDKIKLFISK